MVNTSCRRDRNGEKERPASTIEPGIDDIIVDGTKTVVDAEIHKQPFLGWILTGIGQQVIPRKIFTGYIRIDSFGKIGRTVNIE